MSDSLLDLGTDPIFTAVPNWQSSPSAGLDTGREVIQYNQAYASIRSLTLNNFRTVQYSYFNRTKLEEYYLINFFYTQRGRLKRFWLPVNYQEFILTVNIISGETHCHYSPNGFETIAKLYERIYIVLKDGTQITRKIDSISSDRINFVDAITQNIATTDVRQFGLILLARFDQDEIELQHTTDNLSECSIAFKELPDEYDL